MILVYNDGIKIKEVVKMKEIISKGLLSEVLKLKMEEIVSIELDKNTDFMSLDSDLIKITIDNDLACKQGLVRGYSIRYINIYEMANRCKKWASSEPINFHIRSTNYCGNKGTAQIMFIGGSEIFSGGSEIEEIFNLCQYILDNNENK